MTLNDYYRSGSADEDFVARKIESVLGGKTEKSSEEEDMYDHVDIWWDTPKKGRIGIDVKGMHKWSRSSTQYTEDVHWLELRNVQGNAGWLYGKAEYIAFRTLTQIIFVKRTRLLDFAIRAITGKAVVYDNPNEFYVPYTRRRFGRNDLLVKVRSHDIQHLASFTIFL